MATTTFVINRLTLRCLAGLLLFCLAGNICQAAAPRSRTPEKETSNEPEDRAPSARGGISVELKPKKFTSIDQEPLVLAKSYLEKESQPASLKNLPEKLAGRQSFFKANVSGKTFWILVESFELNEDIWWEAARPPRIYVDVDGDGDFKNAKSARTYPANGSYGYRFSAVELQVPDDREKRGYRAVPVLFERDRYDYLTMAPASCNWGRLTRGTQSHLILIVDSDLDGRYDDVYDPDSISKTKQRSDTIAIDLNGDRAFQYEYFVFVEVQPLTEMVHIEDDYYSIKVEQDGSMLHLEKVDPEMGTLDVGYPDAELITLSDAGLHHLHEADGKWRIPVGNYSTLSMAINKRDGRDRWRLEAKGSMGKLASFQIAENKTTTIKMGPPLTLETNVRKVTSNAKGATATFASIGLSIKGQAQAEYAAGVVRNGKQALPPLLKISDPKGKPVHAAKFEYG